MTTKQNHTIPLTAIVNGKHVCLVCDARDMTGDIPLEDHLTGRKHQYNLYLFNNPESLSVKRQKKLIKNTVCIIDCPKPFRFVCFACDSPTMNQKEALDHIESKIHNVAVNRFQIKH